VFQIQRVHAGTTATAFVEFAHQAAEGDDSAGIVCLISQRGIQIGNVEVLLLHPNHVQPPVIGGKKATSSSPCRGWLRATMHWSTATRTRDSSVMIDHAVPRSRTR